MIPGCYENMQPMTTSLTRVITTCTGRWRRLVGFIDSTFQIPGLRTSSGYLRIPSQPSDNEKVVLHLRGKRFGGRSTQRQHIFYHTYLKQLDRVLTEVIHEM